LLTSLAIWWRSLASSVPVVSSPTDLDSRKLLKKSKKSEKELKEALKKDSIERDEKIIRIDSLSSNELQREMWRVFGNE
jgi:hypothetical protein